MTMAGCGLWKLDQASAHSKSFQPVGACIGLSSSVSYNRSSHGLWEIPLKPATQLPLMV